MSFVIRGAVGACGGIAEPEFGDLHSCLVRPLARCSFIGGRQAVTWNGADTRSRPRSDGIHFLRARSAGTEHRLKLVVLR